MSLSREGKSPAQSGKKTSFYVGGTYSLILNLPDLPEQHAALLTLSAEDASYRQTIRVSEERVSVGDDRYRFTFTGVIPDRIYTLTYHTETDQQDSGVEHDLFIRAQIGTSRMNRLDPHDHPLLEEY
jgi:hypothetical protein